MTLNSASKASQTITEKYLWIALAATQDIEIEMPMPMPGEGDPKSEDDDKKAGKEKEDSGADGRKPERAKAGKDKYDPGSDFVANLLNDILRNADFDYDSKILIINEQGGKIVGKIKNSLNKHNCFETLNIMAMERSNEDRDNLVGRYGFDRDRTEGEGDEIIGGRVAIKEWSSVSPVWGDFDHLVYVAPSDVKTSDHADFIKRAAKAASRKEIRLHAIMPASGVLDAKRAKKNGGVKASVSRQVYKGVASGNGIIREHEEENGTKLVAISAKINTREL